MPHKTIRIAAPSTAQPRTNVGRRLRADFAALGAVLLRWQRRASERHRLAEMSEHMRRDLGLNDVDIMREARKPFWQP